MDGRAEPVQRLEMLRHAVAHVALEAVAGMRERQPHHQPVARDLGDDRGRRDRRHQRVAGDHRLAVAAAVDAVAAVDEHELAAAPAAPAPRAPAPTARRAGCCRGRSGRSSRRRRRPRRWRRSLRRASRAPRGRASWNRSSPRGTRSGSRMTAAATTGPASGPRPASSQPATGQTPRASARRSRRNVGRRISSASGRRAAFFATLAAAVQLMRRRSCAPGALKSNGTKFRPRMAGKTWLSPAGSAVRRR